jgi:hypothetical protein
VRYADVEHALVENANVVVQEAPRGRDTVEIEQQIAEPDTVVSALTSEVQDLAHALVLEKSSVVRTMLREKET